MDGLAGAEFETAAGDAHALALAAGEMHLDAPALHVEEGLMAEGANVEIAAKLAIDAREQIEIEARGDALGVVVGGVEDRRILHQVDADDQGCAGTQHVGGVLHESGSVMRLKIADGRSRKES